MKHEKCPSRSKSILSLIHVLGVFAALSFCPIGSRAVAEEIRVGGGAAPLNNILKKIKEPFEKSTKIKLTLKEDGPDAALRDLDNGTLDAATAGLSFDGWIEMMAEKKIALKNTAEFKHRVIGKDLIQVFVHPDIKIKSLNSDQLSKLFSGEAKSWKEVGGPDIPVQVISGSKIPGTYKFFREKTMGKKEYSASAIDGVDTEGVLAKVKSTPGGVGLGPMSKKGGSVNAPEIPELGRPITVVTRGAPSASMTKLFDFISGEGKKYLSK